MDLEAWIVLSLAVGVPLLFILAGFVVGCFERQCVRMFRDATLTSLPPYLAATMRDASALGFVGIAGGVHTKFGDKVLGVLCLSGDGLVLAIIGEGTILGMPSKRTTLFSRTRSGQVLSTTDEFGSPELDPQSTRKIVLNARIAELLEVQRRLIQESPSPAVPFDRSAGWAAADELAELRCDRIVQAGLARYCDGQRDFYRYTLWGSFRTTIVHGIAQILRPQNYWRQRKRRAG